MTKGYTRIFKR